MNGISKLEVWRLGALKGMRRNTKRTIKALPLPSHMKKPLPVNQKQNKNRVRYSYRTRARKHFFQTQRHPKEIIYSGSNKNKCSQNFTL